MEDKVPTENVPNKRNKIRLFVYLGIFTIAIIIVYFTIMRGPKLEKPVIIHISQGDRMPAIAKILEEKRLIRSPLFFQSFVAFFGGDQKINPGDYYFESSIWLPGVAYRMARGVHNIDPIKITIPEGSNNNEMVKIFEKKLPNFNSDLFNQQSSNLQGQLFPDTYFIYPMTSVDEIIKLMNSTFKNKTKNILINGYKNYSQNEILTMASIVEEEANGNSDRDIIAGILWHRLEKGMMLQVDVAPVTYKVKGLPPSPITNFGIKSLEATVNPKDSVYLFYLHDKNGMIHLAKTYTEHKNNIRKYLK